MVFFCTVLLQSWPDWKLVTVNLGGAVQAGNDEGCARQAHRQKEIYMSSIAKMKRELTVQSLLEEWPFTWKEELLQNKQKLQDIFPVSKTQPIPVPTLAPSNINNKNLGG